MFSENTGVIHLALVRASEIDIEIEFSRIEE